MRGPIIVVGVLLAVFLLLGIFLGSSYLTPEPSKPTTATKQSDIVLFYGVKKDQPAYPSQASQSASTTQPDYSYAQAPTETTVTNYYTFHTPAFYYPYPRYILLYPYPYPPYYYPKPPRYPPRPTPLPRRNVWWV